jgi:hypothetical protein
MNGQYYYVLFPAEKKVYLVKRDEFERTVDSLCEKLFRHGYLENEGVDTTPTRLTPLVYARTLAHYAGVMPMEREGIAELIFLPLLDECECAPSTKEFFLILLDKYIQGEISPVELVKRAMRRFLKLSKSLKVYKVKFY